MKKSALIAIFSLILLLGTKLSYASPIISGISTNEIDIDSKFDGTKILLFGAKGDAGDIIVAVRGPKKDFLVNKKQRLLCIWLNGQRVKFKDTYGFYSLFSTFKAQESIDHLLKKLELGENNINFHSENKLNKDDEKEFRLQLIDKLERDNLYKTNFNKVEFLDETLFKVVLDFPKNISRGIYAVEIYLISEGSLLSFQSIPIYVNQAGFSAKVLDFAYGESFLYGIMAVVLALLVGWIINFLFVRYIEK